MKTFFIGFLIGGGLVYGALSFQPTLLVTVEGTTTDSTSVKTDTIAVPEIPTPANVSIDTTKADTIK